jgi:hypothetical protein
MGDIDRRSSKLKELNFGEVELVVVEMFGTLYKRQRKPSWREMLDWPPRY